MSAPLLRRGPISVVDYRCRAAASSSKAWPSWSGRWRH